VAHRGSSGRTVVLELEKRSGIALHRQLYEAIRSRIVDGSFRGGAPIASTRVLARDLRVSRSTISLAFEQLKAEGYLDCRRGAATRVCAVLPDRFHSVPASSPAPNAGVHRAVASARAARVAAIPRSPDITGSPPRAFRVAVPAVDTFSRRRLGPPILARRWEEHQRADSRTAVRSGTCRCARRSPSISRTGREYGRPPIGS
jgi:GntR family transcriptional regulator/MocR family aminotransferase